MRGGNRLECVRYAEMKLYSIAYLILPFLPDHIIILVSKDRASNTINARTLIGRLLAASNVVPGGRFSGTYAVRPASCMVVLNAHGSSPCGFAIPCRSHNEDTEKAGVSVWPPNLSHVLMPVTFPSHNEI